MSWHQRRSWRQSQRQPRSGTSRNLAKESRATSDRAADPRRARSPRLSRPGTLSLLRRLSAQWKQPRRLPPQQPPRGRRLPRGRRAPLRETGDPASIATRNGPRGRSALRQNRSTLDAHRLRIPRNQPRYLRASSCGWRQEGATIGASRSGRSRHAPTVATDRGCSDPRPAHRPEPLRQHFIDAPTTRGGASVRGDRPLPMGRRRRRYRAELPGRERVPGRSLRVDRLRPDRADVRDLPLHRSRRS